MAADLQPPLVAGWIGHRKARAFASDGIILPKE
jgi:hypothetical protein